MSDWQPIETLPADGKSVLLCGRNRYDPEYAREGQWFVAVGTLHLAYPSTSDWG